MGILNFFFQIYLSLRIAAFLHIPTHLKTITDFNTNRLKAYLHCG